MLRVRFLLVCGMCLGLVAGCGGGDDDKKKKEPEKKKKAAHGGHTAEHGGTLVELEYHKAHVEVVLLSEEGILQVFVSGAHAYQAMEIEMERMEAEVKVGGETLAMKLDGVEAKGGRASLFEGKNEKLKGASEVEVKIKVVDTPVGKWEGVEAKAGASAG